MSLKFWEDRSAGNQKYRKPEGRKPGAITRTVQKFEQSENSHSARKFAQREFFYLHEVACFPFSAQNNPVLYIFQFYP